MRILVVSVALSLGLLIATVARADDMAEAMAAFEEGKVLFNEHKYAEAAGAFRRAHEIKPNWKLLFNIGQSEAAAKHYGFALDAFEAYLVDGGDDIPLDRQDQVQKEIDRLSRLSGELEVEAPDGAVVHVDGQKRGKLPLPCPIRIAAGMHQIQVKQGETVLAEQHLRITGRGKSLVRVPQPSKETEVVATTQEEPVEEPEAAKDNSKLATWGWILGGTGAALAIAGAVTGGVAVSKHGDLENNCPDKTCSTQPDYDLRDHVDTLKVTTDVLLPLGGALIVAGIVMIVYGRKDSEKSARMRVVPVVAGSQGGLLLEGMF